MLTAFNQMQADFELTSEWKFDIQKTEFTFLDQGLEGREGGLYFLAAI